MNQSTDRIEHLADLALMLSRGIGGTTLTGMLVEHSIRLKLIEIKQIAQSIQRANQTKTEDYNHTHSGVACVRNAAPLALAQEVR